MSSQLNAPEILAIMLGTAGHVDHGKTALVRHLTGVNTDRHKEEQARGMSIDFGVAPLLLPGGRLVGIIDVPGHEDFIRNMVSGAASIDVLMLIVAADDAVMPQTIEHMQIVSLLGLAQVMVVITKIDLVDADLLELVKEDVAKFMAQTGFPEAPMLCVSNETGEGIEQVKNALTQLLATVKREPDRRAFRMYARDVFSIKGYGTVITGVPCSGSIKAGDNLELLPARKLTGLRAVQTYKHETDSTQAHVSAALNLRDLQPDEVSRGMVLAEPGVFGPSRSALAWIRNTSGVKPLKQRSKLKFHVGTAAVVANVRLINVPELAPGAAGFAAFHFEQPLVFAAGDKFVLRVLSPADTIGGGIILSINAGRLRRKTPLLEARLNKALERARQGDVLGSELYAGSSALVKDDQLSRLAQTDKARAHVLITEKQAAGEMIKLSEGKWLIAKRGSEISKQLKKLLARYHGENKYAWGMKPAYVAELLGLPVGAMDKLSQILFCDGEIVTKHGYLALKSFSPEINEREMKLREAVVVRVTQAGAGSVARGDLQAELSMSNAEVKLITKLLVDEGIVCVLGNNYMLRTIVEECRTKLFELFAQNPVVELGPFREKTGLSRNIAVIVLEHFDSEGLTRRQGNGRILAHRK
jgi:selenocysteine-specific elongation factor